MVDSTYEYEAVIALYSDFDTASAAIEELIDAGVERRNINIISNDVEGRYANYLEVEEGYEEDDSDAGEAAGFGAVVGSLVGLGAALLPGVGSVLAIGPFAAALISGIGAGTGAVTGGLVGALTDIGAETERAETYAEIIRRGGTAVIIETAASEEDWIEDILHNHNPIDVDEIEDYYRESGWTGYDETAEPLDVNMVTTERETFNRDYDTETGRVYRHSSDESLYDRATRYGYRDYDAYDDNFRSHWNATYASTGLRYNAYAPAYRFGYSLGTDPRYRNYTWDRMEPVARSRWEEDYDTPWEDFKESVRHAWQRVTEDNDSNVNNF